MGSASRKVLLVFMLAVASSGAPRAASAAPSDSPPTASAIAPGEARLEARLIAPCCWTQTLDVHESDLSSSLRAEIRARLLSGESPDAIEDDMARRFGERIRAVPKGKDPRATGSIAIGVVAVLVAGLLVAMVRGWTTRKPPPPTGEAPPHDPAEDARLDDELRELGS